MMPPPVSTTDQVTFWFDELFTVAVKVMDPEGWTPAEDGLTETVIAGGGTAPVARTMEPLQSRLIVSQRDWLAES
jgi:hypothetical protein